MTLKNLLNIRWNNRGTDDDLKKYCINHSVSMRKQKNVSYMTVQNRFKWYVINKNGLQVHLQAQINKYYYFVVFPYNFDTLPSHNSKWTLFFNWNNLFSLDRWSFSRISIFFISDIYRFIQFGIHVTNRLKEKKRNILRENNWKRKKKRDQSVIASNSHTYLWCSGLSAKSDLNVSVTYLWKYVGNGNVVSKSKIRHLVGVGLCMKNTW